MPANPQANVLAYRAPKRARSRMLFTAWLSLSVHGLPAVWFAWYLSTAPEIEVVKISEVDLVEQPNQGGGGGRPDGGAGTKIYDPTKPQAEPRPRRVSRGLRHARGDVVKAAPAETEPPSAPSDARGPEQPDNVSPLLSMRSPDASSEPPAPPADRFASFYARKSRGARTDRTRASAPQHERAASEGDPAARPEVVAEASSAHANMMRYADGGRTISARGDGTGGGPGHGEMGLLDLASSRLGNSVGSKACDPYRNKLGDDPRDLVLLVDTSSSMVRSNRAPASLVCAAGAALSAIDHGYNVTVVNFSTVALRFGPTQDLDVVYKALSLQSEGTLLPKAELLSVATNRPTDFVLISDVAIANLDKVLPAYRRALKANPKNRALLYYLGNEDPAAVDMVRRSGFKTEEVEHMAGS